MKLHIASIAVAVLASASSALAFSSYSANPIRSSAVATITPGIRSTTMFATTAEPFVNGDVAHEDNEATAMDGDSAKDRPFHVSIPTVATIFVSTVSTFALHNYFAVDSIAASSLAGMIAAYYMPEKLALAALCGSFAGMAKLAVIPGMLSAGILGLLCAAVYTVFQNEGWLEGYGGRLGFIAQCACTLQFLLMFPRRIIAPSSVATLFGSFPEMSILAADLPTIFSFTTLGALFVRYWKESLQALFVNVTNRGESSFSFLGRLINRFNLRFTKRMATSVGAVGATGLLASLFLPAPLAAPVYCGAFIAKSAPWVLPNYNSLVPACLLASVAQQALSGVMKGGWGGKPGTAALIGVVSYAFLFRNDYLDDLDLDESLLPEATNKQDVQQKAAPPAAAALPEQSDISVPARQAETPARPAPPATPEQPAVSVPVHQNVTTTLPASAVATPRQQPAASVPARQNVTTALTTPQAATPPGRPAASVPAHQNVTTTLPAPAVTPPGQPPASVMQATNARIVAPPQSKPVAPQESDDDAVEMSVLMAAKGKLENATVAVAEQPKGTAMKFESAARLQSKNYTKNGMVATANYYVVRKPSRLATPHGAQPGQATAKPISPFPVRPAQADIPKDPERNGRQYQVPFVIPVRQVLPRDNDEEAPSI